MKARAMIMTATGSLDDNQKKEKKKKAM